MIIDCIIFNGEKECLQIRAEELKPLNVTHVLVESCFTFTGRSNSLKYWDFANLYSYNIKPFLCNNMPNNGNAWDNERTQRDYILTALESLGAQDDDIIIISDADEVPRLEAIKEYNLEMGLTALRMDKFGYYLNCREGVQSWERARIMPFSYLKENSPEEVRNSGFPSEIKNAGWHWSWLGGVDAMINKLNSFSHQEVNNDKLNNRDILEYKFKTGQSLWGDDFWEMVDIDNSFPKYVQDNKEKFKHIIYEKP